MDLDPPVPMHFNVCQGYWASTQPPQASKLSPLACSDVRKVVKAFNGQLNSLAVTIKYYVFGPLLISVASTP